MVESRWLRMSRFARKYDVQPRGLGPDEMFAKIKSLDKYGNISVDAEDWDVMREILDDEDISNAGGSRMKMCVRCKAYPAHPDADGLCWPCIRVSAGRDDLAKVVD